MNNEPSFDAPQKTPLEVHHITWKGVNIEVSWEPECFDGVIAHLEIKAAGAHPLPMTETGYRSHFVQREEVEELGGPIEYVQAWFDQLDDSDPRQSELF